MAAIQNAESAIMYAERLIARYYPFRRLLKAGREDGTWVVEFDVGVLGREVARVRLDAESGHVVDYSTLEAA